MNWLMRVLTTFFTSLGVKIFDKFGPYPWTRICVNLDYPPPGFLSSEWDLNNTKKLGHGNFGVVYDTGNDMVIKKIEFTSIEQATMAYNEIEFLRRLKGVDGVVEYKDCAFKVDHLFIKQQKLHEDLKNKKVLETFAKKTVVEKLKIMKRLSETVNLIHSKKVIHADIKPGNIMALDEDVSQILLIDFGVSYFVDEEYQGGSKFYQSPELWLKQPSIPAGDDLWALVLSIFSIQFDNNFVESSLYFNCLDSFRKGEHLLSTFAGRKGVMNFCLRSLNKDLTKSFESAMPEITHECGTQSFDILKSLFENTLTVNNRITSVQTFINGLNDAIESCIPDEASKVQETELIEDTMPVSNLIQIDADLGGNLPANQPKVIDLGQIAQVNGTSPGNFTEMVDLTQRVLVSHSFDEEVDTIDQEDRLKEDYLSLQDAELSKKWKELENGQLEVEKDFKPALEELKKGMIGSDSSLLQRKIISLFVRQPIVNKDKKEEAENKHESTSTSTETSKKEGKNASAWSDYVKELKRTYALTRIAKETISQDTKETDKVKPVAVDKLIKRFNRGKASVMRLRTSMLKVFNVEFAKNLLTSCKQMII